MHRLTTGFAVAALLGCGGGNDITPPITPPITPAVPGIHVLVGGTTDTVFAILAPGLRVEVHGSGGALAPAGTPVSIAAVGNIEPRTAGIAIAGSTDFRDSLVVVTDASGLAAADVRLGTAAGSAQIAVTVPRFGVADTIAYTVLPGQRVRAQFLSADTSLVIGRSSQVAAVVVDAWGNVRKEPLAPWTIVAQDSFVTTTPEGLVTARAVGISSLGINGPSADLGGSTMAVYAVPAGRVAVEEGFPIGLSLSDADGSHKKLLTLVSGAFDSLFLGSRPAWMPGGASLVFANTENGHKVLDVVDTNGVRRPFFATPPANFTDAAQPAVSADGQWLYFEAMDSRCSTQSYCLYRAKIDGSSLELLGSPESAGTSLHPSPSPDGTRVAIATGYLGSGGIHVFDLATRTLSTWSESGSSPTWSPDGSLIAYVADHGGAMPGAVVRPDGTGQTDITRQTLNFNYLEWSHDGRYIVSVSGNTPILFTSTGQTVVVLQQLPPFNTLEIALP